MAYVYMQQPKPTNATGVPVAISVVDANGNYRTIGTTTSTTEGFYSFTWTPDIAGTYFVYASYCGSESYWPSEAVTSFTVAEAEATPSPVATQAPSAADLYFIPAVAIIAVLVVIVLVLQALAIMKKP